MAVALGAHYDGERLTWSLLGKTARGWALDRAGSGEGATLSAALAAAAGFPARLRPHIGLPFGVAEFSASQLGEPVRELARAVRTETGDARRAVAVYAEASFRLTVHASRDDVRAAVEPWHQAGIAPIGVEPLETAWLRTLPDVDAILDANAEPAVLIGAGAAAVERALVPNLRASKAAGLQTHLENIQMHVTAVRRLLVFGTTPEIESIVHERGIELVTPAIAGEANPPWAHAFALAGAPFAREVIAARRARSRLRAVVTAAAPA